MNEESINTLVGISGKSREECVLALIVTQGNLDMACSLLFEGVDMNQL